METRRALSDSGLRILAAPGFSPSDGFSILNADVDGELLLLDPFANFLPQRAKDIIPKIAQFSRRAACVLFILNLDPNNAVGRRYRELKSNHLRHAWTLRCPRLPDRGVRGESKYEVEVLLAWRRLTDHPGKNELARHLEAYAESLSRVLDTTIVFSN